MQAQTMGFSTFRRPNSSAVATKLIGLIIASSTVLCIILAFTTTLDQVAFAAGINCLGNVLFVCVVARSSLTERKFGLLVLTLCPLLYFSKEALASALSEAPFASDITMHLNAGQFSLSNVKRAFALLNVFILLSIIGYYVTPPPRRVLRWLQSHQDVSIDRTSLISVLCACCGLVPLLYGVNGSVPEFLSVLTAGRSGRVQYAVVYPDVVQHVYYIGMFGCAALLVGCAIHGWRSVRATLFSILAVVCALPLLSTGTRHLMVYILCPLALVLSLRSAKSVKRTRVVAVLAVGGLALALFQFQAAHRTAGWTGETGAEASSWTAKDTIMFDAFLFALEIVPAEHEYFMEPMAPFFIIHFIPRQLWPTKPLPQSFEYYNQRYMGNLSKSGNAAPSVLGQYYINWGPVGIVMIGYVFGALARIADELLRRLTIERNAQMLTSLGMFYGFIICAYRFFSPNYLHYWFFGFVIVCITTTRGRRRNPWDTQIAVS